MPRTRRTVKRKRGGKKIKLTPEQKEQQNHIKEARSIFTKSGFSRIPGVSDKEFTYNGATGDFDDYFIYENILILAEYTITKSENISNHLKKKKILFDKIIDSPSDFIKYLRKKFKSFNSASDETLHPTKYIIRIIYASKYKVDTKHKELVDRIVYLDYPIQKYFYYVADSVKKSARNELLSFLQLRCEDLEGTPFGASYKYKGSILPEAHSNFENGYKVVSFYVDPAALLKRSYVLRQDGWNENEGLYQRMISKNKVESIRRYLKDNKRVFINNIVVTLPNKTKILDDSGNTKDISCLSKTEPVEIQLPDEFNSIGIIDGQHRVFAYHEGGTFDHEIKNLRDRQNLLVTGIIYPARLDKTKKIKFEANLFLEINSNQTNAKSNVKQAIGLLLKPFSAESIAKQVINRLNNNGPLFDKFERYFYDKEKIKTASIVSYALVPIVKLQGNDSFYSLWKYHDKKLLLNCDNSDLLDSYIDFCTKEIQTLFIAVRQVIPKEKWTPSSKIKGRLLTTTFINGLIICLRKLIEHGKTGSSDYYKDRLNNLSEFSFDQYHSSQYARMANDLYKIFFDSHPT